MNTNTNLKIKDNRISITNYNNGRAIHPRNRAEAFRMFEKISKHLISLRLVIPAEYKENQK